MKPANYQILAVDFEEVSAAGSRDDGLPRIGTFTQALYDEAKKDGWFVISMKNDWNHIFAFES
jgi:hypothetical protein